MTVSNEPRPIIDATHATVVGVKIGPGLEPLRGTTHQTVPTFRFRPADASSVRALIGVAAVSDRRADVVQSEAFSQFRECIALPENWDSYAAKRITREALQRALALLFMTAEAYVIWPVQTVLPTDISPIATGGLHLEWRRNSSTLLVEVSPRGGVSFLESRGERPNRTVTEEHNVTVKRLFSVLDSFIKH